MKNFSRQILILKLLIFSLLTLNSCDEREHTVSCFPNVPVNISLNLNLPAYYQLQNAGGWIYVDAALAGTRGLIVINSGNAYHAYDRNAPHICPADDTTLQVVENIKIRCPKDGAEWILLTGQPNNQAAKKPLKIYRTAYDAATKTLSVY
ncbi:hypothetical protein IMZ16_03415 [Cruoricaptor ignavus]|uniref:Ferredoxin subunit of nitrite reductase or a ring-hydroxylating dioxygenase n=1 Tax=Cruoricaptor ignavus TaxID=1118202 RepID=A0A7M1T5D2_9FLAO|nr:hypothetical protein [Cruoricaptor ignavus]QOR74497.1 hypothetical protein IMZ16_03415 [Cruoricaptor ignavus]